MELFSSLLGVVEHPTVPSPTTDNKIEAVVEVTGELRPLADLRRFAGSAD